VPLCLWPRGGRSRLNARYVSRTEDDASEIGLSTRRFSLASVVALALLSGAVGAQGLRSDAGVEDIVILRSLRLSRIAPTDFCAASRTGFTEATIEERYDFKAVATDAASGRVTNDNGARAGTLHACFGPTPDSLLFNFYAEGERRGVRRRSWGVSPDEA
jgi:hypothetical protein